MKYYIFFALSLLGFATPINAQLMQYHIKGEVDLIWTDGRAYYNVKYHDIFEIDMDNNGWGGLYDIRFRETGYEGLEGDPVGDSFKQTGNLYVLRGNGAYIFPGYICDCIAFDFKFKDVENYDWRHATGPIPLASYGKDWWGENGPGQGGIFQPFAMRDFTFQAIPLPDVATWMTMLAGMALAGASMRKRARVSFG